MIKINKIDARILDINSLIEIISKQERGFFYNNESELTAKFELKKGKLFYMDERKGVYKEIKKKTTWIELGEWVSHGSTIRSQIIEFAQFILTGKTRKILSRYWGISFESQRKILLKAREIGLTKQIGFTFHDYTVGKDRHCCDFCGINECYPKNNQEERICIDCEVKVSIPPKDVVDKSSTQ